MDLDYWNVEDIITESQGTLRIPARPTYVCYFLTPDAQTCTRRIGVLDGTFVGGVPRAYGPRVRSALDASPVAVQLRTLLPHWYAMGIRLAQLLDSEDLRAALYKTYMGRLARIYELSILLAGSRSSASEIAAKSSDPTLTTEMQAFLQGLDDSETARTCTYALTTVLSAGQVACRTMQAYLTDSN